MASKEVRTRRSTLFDAILGFLEPGRVLDLGAGHGAFSLRAANAGWDVTAVDARDQRFPDDSRVTWVVQDVRKTDLSGYDLILCLGLWYHLTVDDQIDLVSRMASTRTPVVIDTHVATDTPTHTLSDPVVEKGYEGRYYDERGWARRVTASYQNQESFWPTLDAFHRMLAEHGYPAVFAATPWVTADRTFFFCSPGSS